MITVVEPPEAVFLIEDIGVQRFDATQLADLVLNLFVEVAGRLVIGIINNVPKAEVHVKPGFTITEMRKLQARFVNQHRAHPDLRNTDFLVEETQEIGSPFDRDIDVLNHALGLVSQHLVQFRLEADTRIPAHDFLVGDRIQMAPPHEQAHWQVLHEKMLRTPEPVGIPAPDVIAHLEEILASLTNRTVINLQPTVIVCIRRFIAKPALRQVHLVTAEDGTVDELGVAVTGFVNRPEILVNVVVAGMRQSHIGFDRHGPGREFQNITQRSI